MANNLIGKISQVLGAVVDVEFVSAALGCFDEDVDGAVLGAGRDAFDGSREHEGPPGRERGFRAAALT